MIITFLGHSTINYVNGLAEKVEKTIVDNIAPGHATIFYCGGYGDFDNLCARVCLSIKKKNNNCELIYITPYITDSMQKRIKNTMSTYSFDSVIYPPLEKVPLRLAIIKRNEWMIDQSDLIIAYVNYSFGGSYNSLKYAERKKKRIINLA